MSRAACTFPALFGLVWLCPQTLKPPAHQGLSNWLLTPLLDRSSVLYRYLHLRTPLMDLVVPILRLHKSGGRPRWYFAD